MANVIDLTGHRFGRLTVEGIDHREERKNGGTSVFWKCRCDCGSTTAVRGHSLRSGETKSCGCLSREAFMMNRKEKTCGERNGQYKHGGRKSPLYKVWSNMKRRCNNPADRYYKNYGGKGIKVCQEWQDYNRFRDWALSNGYNAPDPNTRLGQHLSIDRIDPNGDYCPENCRWITLSDNVEERIERPSSRRKAQ